ncbi:MAG: YIP1 family protein, partial [Oscillospiraceae bacterium]|nr:YIP1 family protein [Oscillospiraceae bacterium]
MNQHNTDITDNTKKTKHTKLIRFIVLFFCLVMIGGIPAAAFTTYTTYMYSAFAGNSYSAVESPDAYVPEKVVDSTAIGLDDFLGGVKLDGPTDLFVDDVGNIYIADQKNNRIVVLNPDFTGKFILSTFVNSWGVPDSLSQPQGVFANDTEIYVADTEKNRIVVFDITGKQLRIIDEPESDVFPENHVYKPVALVVDKAGRLYVVSSTTNQGIITMSPTGDFQGFVGAQAAAVNPFQIFWRNFQTQAQRDASLRVVATEYNNVTIDSEGFVYATTDSIEDSAQQSALYDASATYAPVKRLNPQGADVLRRSMAFGSTKLGPGGEAITFDFTNGTPRGTSKIIDVALGPSGQWSIIDRVRQRVYTYDEDGRPLYIFGDEGNYFGNIMSIKAIAYQGTKILLLDNTNNSFTVYKRTDYGDAITSALQNQIDRQYDKSVDDWKNILRRNNNSDIAYIGIGKSLYRNGDYQAAMSEFRFASDVTDYSMAFKEYRKMWIQNYVVVIPIVIVAVILGVYFFMKNANKVNKRDQIRGGRKLKLASHMLYGFHIIFHPFDGFWDMKHEKRGSMLAATIYLILACAAYIYKAIGTAFIVTGRIGFANFVSEALSIILPVILWVISNWCLTTLFDGEGSMKDIYMVTCYSLIPVIVLTVATTLMSHIVIQGEIA